MNREREIERERRNTSLLIFILLSKYMTMAWDLISAAIWIVLHIAYTFCSCLVCERSGNMLEAFIHDSYCCGARSIIVCMPRLYANYMNCELIMNGYWKYIVSFRFIFGERFYMQILWYIETCWEWKVLWVTSLENHHKQISRQEIFLPYNSIERIDSSHHWFWMYDRTGI